MSARSEPSAPTTGGARQRSTRQFQAVHAELETAADFRTAQDIHGALRERRTPVGLATVYRALQSLVDSGHADSLRTDAGESMYRTCESSHHHHHLVCRECNRTVEVQAPAVERWTTRVAKEHGFRDVRHTVELFGVCPSCQAEAGRT